jgi:KUP system potassium uptake protein
MQAIQLGFCPRLEIDHTSSEKRGQIYVPYANWILMLSCIGLVVGFGRSSKLAAAYGIAVSLTMVITTVMFYVVARHVWGWNPWFSALVCGWFVFVELAFFSSNALKILHGGWFPIVAAVIFGIGLVGFLTRRGYTEEQDLTRRVEATKEAMKFVGSVN